MRHDSETFAAAAIASAAPPPATARCGHAQDDTHRAILSIQFVTGHLGHTYTHHSDEMHRTNSRHFAANSKARQSSQICRHRCPSDLATKLLVLRPSLRLPARAALHARPRSMPSMSRTSEYADRQLVVPIAIIILVEQRKQQIKADGASVRTERPVWQREK
jgi:hypothetical protein